MDARSLGAGTRECRGGRGEIRPGRPRECPKHAGPESQSARCPGGTADGRCAARLDCPRQAPGGPRMNEPPVSIPAEPPAWPKTVGTISIVWAGLNLACGVCGMSMALLM